MIIYNIIQVLHYQYLPRRTETCIHTNICPWIFIAVSRFSSQRMKTLQIYTNRWIDLKIRIVLYNEIQLNNNKNELLIHPWLNRDKSQNINNYAE